MTYIISIAFKIIIFLLGLLLGMAIMAYSASKEMAQACDDAYLIGYAKGKEEAERKKQIKSYEGKFKIY